MRLLSGARRLVGVLRLGTLKSIDAVYVYMFKIWIYCCVFYQFWILIFYMITSYWNYYVKKNLKKINLIFKVCFKFDLSNRNFKAFWRILKNWHRHYGGWQYNPFIFQILILFVILEGVGFYNYRLPLPSLRLFLI